MTTLCYVEKEDAYLMMHRISKKNDVNKDKWIGVGGHVEEGESPEECVLREVKEETGLTMITYQFRGIVTFVSKEYGTEYMCVYTSNHFDGEMISCDEGELEWVKKDQVMSLNLWEGDKLMFELLDTRREFFSLKLVYDGNQLVYASIDGKECEFFDQIDEAGNRTGFVKERMLAHREGTFHNTAHIWVVRPNDLGSFDVLLQKRSQMKDSDPGCYDISSAGHMNAGSELLPSALRELKEELGIEAKPSDLTFLFWHEVYKKAEFYGKPFIDHERNGVYLYQKPVVIDELVLQEEEVESVRWMEYEECLAYIIDHDSKFCINEEEFRKLKDYVKF